jgi:methyltransferase (TIGR00027 family)
MRNRPSSTAEDVATVRALLTHWGLLDDPYALRFLRPARRLVYNTLSHAKPTSLGRRAYANILARTRIYDDFVRRAMDDGLRQIVIVGAGYDSRAWRLARKGVHFIEVDHPATQSRKCALAPTGGPDFVAADLGVEEIDEVLGRGEYDASRAAAFVCEGLVFYLDESRARSLVGGLAHAASGGSRIALDLVGASRPRSLIERAITAVKLGLMSEPIRFRLGPRDAPEEFLASLGWKGAEVLGGRDGFARALASTPLANLASAVANPYLVSARL